jgi:hypothetical protein
LVARRRQEAFWIGGPNHEERIGMLVQVHLAIEAIDAVIAEAGDQPDTDVSGFLRSV